MTVLNLIGLHLEIFSASAVSTLVVAVAQRRLARIRNKPFQTPDSQIVSYKLPMNTTDLPGRTRPLTDFCRVLGARTARPLAVLACLGLLTGSANAGDSWTSFQNGGAVELADPLPTSWKPEADVAWTTAIKGYGQSSPVIWKGQIYVTSVEGPKKETFHITAFSLADGKELWRHEIKNSSPQESTTYVSRAAPTPAADAAGVVCFFEGGNVVALTHEGKVRWERDLVKDYGAIESRHGISASIEQDDKAIFAWVERSAEPYVMAIDKTNGETIWKVPGLGTTSWASPRLVPVEGGQHLVLSSIGHLAGLDPKTGDKLWSLDEIAGNSTPTPMPAGEGRFLIGATTGQGPSANAKANESNGMVAISRTADSKWQGAWVWHAARATSSFGSPIVAHGHAYFVNRTGVLYCLDEKTGEEKYAQRSGDSIWATPVATKDHLLLFGKGGTVTAVALGDKFEKLGETAAWESTGGPKPMEGEGGPPDRSAPVLYGAAIADGKLLLRRGDQLICIKAPQ
jgi:outer membrane protein assembly factor BamB